MTEISVQAEDLSVDIGFPCGSQLPWQTALSLTKTAKYLTERRIAMGVCCIAGSSVVTWARSKVLDTFLQGKAKHLFWIDSDIVWEPENLLKMIALATKYQVVCGAYAQKTDAQTIVIRHPDLSTYEINPHGLVKIQGSGLGFTVITREVAQKLSDSKPFAWDPVEERPIRDVFRLDTMDRGHEFPDVRHEDIAFFADLIELGYDIWLDPTAQLGHVGAKVYRNNPLTALRLDGVLGATDGPDALPAADVPGCS